MQSCMYCHLSYFHWTAMHESHDRGCNSPKLGWSNSYNLGAAIMITQMASNHTYSILPSLGALWGCYCICVWFLVACPFPPIKIHGTVGNRKDACVRVSPPSCDVRSPVHQSEIHWQHPLLQFSVPSSLVLVKGTELPTPTEAVPGNMFPNTMWCWKFLKILLKSPGLFSNSYPERDAGSWRFQVNPGGLATLDEGECGRQPNSTDSMQWDTTQYRSVLTVWLASPPLGICLSLIPSSTGAFCSEMPENQRGSVRQTRFVIYN